MQDDFMMTVNCDYQGSMALVIFSAEHHINSWQDYAIDCVSTLDSVAKYRNIVSLVAFAYLLVQPVEKVKQQRA